ncbi:N-6 DNA methylase [Nocardiopsis tropica]|uniref:N-6 DNA methylase n=1 Tax=Nocardiopsis tropica TaxID=109330 RepID=UPI002E829816|nr:N-6 DNA methylase [Nocardiopsis tropica]
MDEHASGLVSRAQLARYAGVSRAAVTNWAKRGPDFPEPAEPGKELFDLGQVTAWLAGRTIPADARRPGEVAGTTYAARVRASLADPDPSLVPARAPERRNAPGKQDLERALWRILDHLRGRASVDANLKFLLHLIDISVSREQDWRELLRQPTYFGTASSLISLLPARRHGLPDPPDLQHALPDVLREVEALVCGGDRREEAAAFFDHVLTRLTEVTGKAGQMWQTPASVVEIAVRILDPRTPPRAVHDPYCRTGEFLISMERWLRTNQPTSRARFSGIPSSDELSDIAAMRLRVHGVEAELVPGANPYGLRHRARADLVLVNPLFNLRWATDQHLDDDPYHLPYGRPPLSNANFVWLQSVATTLRPGGRAAVVMPPSAASSSHPGEQAIRAAMVEDGVVEAVVSLPDRLFQNTGVPVDIWLLQRPAGTPPEVLFVDARKLGTVSRTERSLAPGEIDDIVSTVTAWRGGAPASGMGCAVGLDKIRERNHSLLPASYVPPPVQVLDVDEERERFEALNRRLRLLEKRLAATDAPVSRLIEETRRWTRP